MARESGRGGGAAGHHPYRNRDEWHPRPGVYLRSPSLCGLSSLVLIFSDDATNDWNRQRCWSASRKSTCRTVAAADRVGLQRQDSETISDPLELRPARTKRKFQSQAATGVPAHERDSRIPSRPERVRPSVLCAKRPMCLSARQPP
ncbi:hypothetical protein SBA3_4130007 [Candidatus Sulfopaludibacter sp. SbA3]|nr:hypothetical protein SBA3_4130007 [Candidatus Sulfopaludibacter sp. SbA3]